MKDKKDSQLEEIITEMAAWPFVIIIIYILAKITLQF